MFCIDYLDNFFRECIFLCLLLVFLYLLMPSYLLSIHLSTHLFILLSLDQNVHYELIYKYLPLTFSISASGIYLVCVWSNHYGDVGIQLSNNINIHCRHSTGTPTTIIQSISSTINYISHIRIVQRPLFNVLRPSLSTFFS